MKLLRYIQGLRKGKDAHRIEKDAMTDPFLADALEGFDTVDENHTERIERMQRRVAQLSQRNNNVAAASVAAKKSVFRSQPAVMAEESLCAEMSVDEEKMSAALEPQPTEKKKRRSLTVWLAAAVVLLFVATGGYFWLLKEEAVTPQLATTTEKQQVSKDAAAEEDTMMDASLSGELMESTAKVIAQDTRESVTRQQQVVPAPSLVIPPPPIPPTINDIEESRIFAEVEESIPTENLDRYLRFNTGLDSIANFNNFKLSDTATSSLLAFSKEINKIQHSGSVVTIKANELGIHSNTNRDALSQPLSGAVAREKISKKETEAKDVYALSQSQIHLQGKIGGKLAGQSKPTTSRAEQRMATADIAPSPILSSGNVTGRVVDQNGEPIPFATVQVKGTTTGVITDMEGYFALNAKNAERLVASLIGFEQVELSADTTRPMLIAMNEDSAQLEEVVVIGYATQKKATFSGSVTSVNAEDYNNQNAVVPQPETGYSAYRSYLNSSMIRPTDECSEAEGRVVLNFYVNSNGRPYNIEVARSLCPSADQEAIRLVEEGGRWTIGERQVRLSIKF